MTEEQPNARDLALLAVFFVTCGILIIFLWSPVAHYLGKWNDFWENMGANTVTVVDDFTSIKNSYAEALNECYARAKKYFQAEWVSVFVNKIGSTTDYKTYDCYAYKYTKIP